MNRPSKSSHTAKQSRSNPGATIRSRGDAQAHQEAAGHRGVTVNHPLVPGQWPALHADQSGLTRQIERLAATGEFAYDSEFIGEQTYHARFCLLQVATSEEIALIDALAPVDLNPVWHVLADPGVRKIVHAGRQDLEPVVRFLDRSPRNIFDVQLAAGFAGLAYPMSLDRLLSALVGIDMAHDAKLSQWDRRPLSPMQQRYAADDVRYLPLLVRTIEQRLDDLGNRAWCQAEMRNLETAQRYRYDPLAQKLRIKGLGELDQPQWAVLNRLLHWRAALARQEDVPPRMLVEDEALAGLARDVPRRVTDLGKVRFLPRPVIERFGEDILEVIDAGRQGPLPPMPYRPPPLSGAQKSRIESLWKAAKQCCQDHRIDPGVVLAKRDIIHYVRIASDSSAPSPPSRLLEGWRGELLGDVLRSQ